MNLLRRQFLTGVALGALSLALPVKSNAYFPHGAPAVVPVTFKGNPNVTITTIDVSGGIACSRTSGKTPCFIQVSASNITADTTPAPYEDLSYSWNFGDPPGTETFTNPVTGATVNANTDQ